MTTQAVILAGGLGTRLGNLTKKIPKPLLPVGDKPFLEWMIRCLVQSGITDFIFCLSYLAEQIQKHFGDGRNLNCSIRYSVEEKPLGTGGAIKQAGEFLKETFLVLNGDNFLLINYRNFIETFFHSQNKIGMLACWRNQSSVFQSNVKLSEKDKRILSYHYLDSTDMDYVDSGVKIFSKALLSYFGPQMVFSLEKDVLPKLAREDLLMGYISGDHALDIGTPENLEKTRTRLEKVFSSHAKS